MIHYTASCRSSEPESLRNYSLYSSKQTVQVACLGHLWSLMIKMFWKKPPITYPILTMSLTQSVFVERLVSSSTCSARIMVRLQPRSQAFYKAGTSHTYRPVATRNQASLTKSAKNCDDKITQSAHLCNPHLAMVGYTLLNLCNSAITIIDLWLILNTILRQLWTLLMISRKMVQSWLYQHCIGIVIVLVSSWSKWHVKSEFHLQ